MRSYLSLIPISAKVRKRKNRMTILCIVISVFLVTAIFSVADMMIRTQNQRMIEKNGSWHIMLKGISQETADKIAERDDVVSVGAAVLFNEDGELPYRINEKRVVLYGIDEAYLMLHGEGADQGTFPQGEREIMLSSNAAFALQVEIGGSVVLHTPGGDRYFTVSGLGGVDESYYGSQYFLMDAYLPCEVLLALLAQNGVYDIQTEYYVQFTSAAQAAQTIPVLTAQYDLPEGALSENVGVMGAAGQSSSGAMKNVYGLAGVLFVLVLLAGVLMISGSMNSNVAQRTQFFGMMRCIGMSKRQVIRFVRLEALNWCKTAVPMGLLLGTLVSWGICGALHYGIGGEFSTTPVFQISPVGLVSGIAVGVVTVLFAAQSPARRAARVSPMAAVSGSSGDSFATPALAGRRSRRVERSLGIHHAVASKKNWCLMTASFAFSIILALCFSVLLELSGLLLPSLCPWQPDILLNGYGNAQVLPRTMVEELRTIPGVQTVWGATGLTDLPASSQEAGIDHVTLCSYDDFMLESSKEVLISGTMAAPSDGSSQGMTIYNRNNPLKVGDTVCINGTDLTISCAFSQGAFSDDVVVICSQALFDRIIGTQNYNMVGILLADSATEETVAQIARLTTDEIIVTDMRESNLQTEVTYLASRIVVYGFLAIIGLISLFNIVNSISMSVSARTKQYGAMRAIGMDSRQLKRMIAAEAGTYGLSGLVVGFGIGLPLNRMLYIRLVTRYFGVAWSLPVTVLVILALFVVIAVVAAVRAPAKRMSTMAITSTINAL